MDDPFDDPFDLSDLEFDTAPKKKMMIGSPDAASIANMLESAQKDCITKKQTVKQLEVWLWSAWDSSNPGSVGVIVQYLLGTDVAAIRGAAILRWWPCSIFWRHYWKNHSGGQEQAGTKSFIHLSKTVCAQAIWSIHLLVRIRICPDGAGLDTDQNVYGWYLQSLASNTGEVEEKSGADMFTHVKDERLLAKPSCGPWDRKLGCRIV